MVASVLGGGAELQGAVGWPQFSARQFCPAAAGRGVTALTAKKATGRALLAPWRRSDVVVTRSPMVTDGRKGGRMPPHGYGETTR